MNRFNNYIHLALLCTSTQTSLLVASASCDKREEVSDYHAVIRAQIAAEKKRTNYYAQETAQERNKSVQRIISFVQDLRSSAWQSGEKLNDSPRQLLEAFKNDMGQRVYYLSDEFYVPVKYKKRIVSLAELLSLQAKITAVACTPDDDQDKLKTEFLFKMQDNILHRQAEELQKRQEEQDLLQQTKVKRSRIG